MELHGAGHAEVKVCKGDKGNRMKKMWKLILILHLLLCSFLIRDVNNSLHINLSIKNLIDHIKLVTIN